MPHLEINDVVLVPCNIVSSKPLQIERKINITLVISYSVKYKKSRAIKFNLEVEYF